MDKETFLVYIALWEHLACRKITESQADTSTLSTRSNGNKCLISFYLRHLFPKSPTRNVRRAHKILL